MTLGQKIKKLRSEKQLTQKDLADQMHVTFQTVSKWEKDENEPDVSTLRELAKLFGCSMDYLLSEEELEPVKEEEKVEEPAPIQEVTKTVIIHQKELHVCRRCNKDIPENELYVEHLYRTERHGRTSSRVPAGEAFYHQKCHQLVVKEREEAERAAKKAHASRGAKWSFGWGIFAGIVGLGGGLALFLALPYFKENLHPGLAVLFAVLIGYALFADLYCIISGSYIGDVFVETSSWSIKFPGIIFSWDLGGFAFLIVMKVLFAILGFLAGLAAFLFAVGLTALLGAVSFPFVLVHNIHTDYEDSMVD